MTSELRVGSLFSGIGGMDLGLERAGMRTVWFCEREPFCQAVLEHHWPGVPCYPDVTQLRGADVEPVDVLCGGFPCQDLSWAGPGAGIGGARSGLWSEYARLVGELRPRYVVVENVSALLARGLGVVLGDLAAVGYDAEWDCIPASAVGAPHRRDRIWLVAYPGGEQHEGVGAPQRRPSAARLLEADPNSDQTGRGELEEHDGGPVEMGGRPSGGHADGLRDEVADADEGGRARRSRQLRPGGWGEPANRGGEQAGPGLADWWATEPDVGRVAHGVPARVDRLAALGNSLVPQIAEWIGQRIVDHELGEQRDAA